MKKVIRKINIVLAAVNAVILLLCGILYACICSIRDETGSDNAKKVWDNEKYSYSQISLFAAADSGIDDMAVYSLRSQIDDRLDAVISTEDRTEGRLWIDCACGETSLTLSGSMGSCAVTAVGTFGDYFIFHNDEILDGSVYSELDVNADRIVIDKICSWQLFGSVETEGLPVTIGSRVYYVAAVIDVLADGTERKAYGEVPRVYMPYEILKGIDSKLSLTVYEVCLPNVMKDYAYSLVEELNPISGDFVLVDQTKRFDPVTLFKGSRNIGENVMITKAVKYPWYENITRSGEIKAQLLASAGWLLMIPLISLVYALFILTRLGGSLVKKLRNTAEEKYQKKISELYRKKKEI